MNQWIEDESTQRVYSKFVQNFLEGIALKCFLHSTIKRSSFSFSVSHFLSIIADCSSSAQQIQVICESDRSMQSEIFMKTAAVWLPKCQKLLVIFLLISHISSATTAPVRLTVVQDMMNNEDWGMFDYALGSWESQLSNERGKNTSIILQSENLCSCSRNVHDFNISNAKLALYSTSCHPQRQNQIERHWQP